jgi:hypothetical protein
MTKRQMKPHRLVGYLGPPAIHFEVEETIPAATEDSFGSVTINDGLTEIINVSQEEVSIGTVAVAVQLEKDKYVVVGSGGGGSKIFKIEDDELGIGPAVIKAKMVTISTEPSITLTVASEFTDVINFRTNYVFNGKYYVCFKIDGNWILDNQADFLENF